MIFRIKTLRAYSCHDIVQAFVKVAGDEAIIQTEDMPDGRQKFWLRAGRADGQGNLPELVMCNEKRGTQFWSDEHYAKIAIQCGAAGGKSNASRAAKMAVEGLARALSRHLL